MTRCRVQHSPRARDLLAILGLVLLVAAFFWPIWAGGYWLPQGGGDLASFLWPTWSFSAQSFREGTIPLWNPSLYAGAPFVGDNQSSMFYPPNLMFALFPGQPSYLAMELYVVLHMELAALFMYLLLRDKRLSRTAAVLGGVAFGLSDIFVTHIGNANLNATIAYLPGVLLLLDRALLRRSAAWAAATGGLLAIAALAGHGQMLLIIAFAAVVLAVFRLVLSLRDGYRNALKVAGLAVLAAAVGVAGAAVALLPNAELIQQTGRAALSWADAVRYSVPVRALVGLVAPGFFGRGPSGFWGPWDRVEVGYLGMLTLALAAGGVAAGLVRGRRRSGAFPIALFASLALLGIGLALGDRTPLYGWLHALPGFSGLRAPARFVALAEVGLAGLAAYGLDRLRESRVARIVVLGGLGLGIALALALPRLISVPADRWLAVRDSLRITMCLGAVGIVGVGLVWLRPRARWTGVGAVLLVALDVVVMGSRIEVQREDPTIGFSHAGVVEFLASDPSVFRIDSSAASKWQPDAAAMLGLRDMSGISNPLSLARYQSYRWSIAARGDALYSLLGVKYALSDKGAAPGDSRLVPVYTGDASVDVYLNTAALPMAQLLYSVTAAPTAEVAWEAIHRSDFDPTRSLVIEATPMPVWAPDSGERSVRYVEYSANEIVLDVSTPVPAYLLLSEVYTPGWRTTIDSEAADVVRADYLFRAVYVPAGSHRIRHWYSPTSFRAGLAISCRHLDRARGSGGDALGASGARAPTWEGDDRVMLTALTQLRFPTRLRDGWRAAERALWSWPFGAPLLVAVVATLARLPRISWYSVELDESFSAILAHVPLGQLVSDLLAMQREPHPPTYFVLLKPFLWALGDTEFGLRLLGCLLGIVFCVLVFALGRSMASRGVGLAAGLLCAVNPALVFESLYARMYMPAATFFLAGTLALWTASRKGGVGRFVLAFGLLTLACYTQLGAAMALAALGAALLAARGPRLAAGLATVAAVGVVWAPYGLKVWSVSATQLEIVLRLAPGPVEMARYAANWVVLHLAPHSAAVGVALAIAVWAVVVWALASRRTSAQARVWLAALMLVPLALFVILSARHPLLQPKMLVITSSAAMLLLLSLPRKWWLVAGVFALELWGYWALWQPTAPREDWRRVGAYLSRHSGPEDKVLVYLHYYREPLRWYYSGPILSPFGSAIGTDAEIAATLVDALDARVLWLVQSGPQAADPDKRLQRWLEARYPCVTSQYPSRVSVKGFLIDSRAGQPLPGTRPLSVEFEGGGRLSGVWLDADILSPRDEWVHPPSAWLHVVLYGAPADYGVTLEDEHGAVWGVPLARVVPPGYAFATPEARLDYDLNLNPETPPGEYKVVVRAMGADGPFRLVNSEETWLIAGRVRITR